MPLCRKCRKKFEGDRCPLCGKMRSRVWNTARRALDKRINYLVAGLFGVLAADLMYPLLDRDRMFVLAIVLFFLPVLIHIASGVRKRLQVDAASLTKMYGWFAASLATLAAVVFLNGAADRSNAVEIPTSVVHKRVLGGRSISYRLIVQSWRPGRQEENLDVNGRTFRRAREGRQITIEVHKGLVGLPWYSKITPL
jgi:hypothetical protein